MISKRRGQMAAGLTLLGFVIAFVVVVVLAPVYFAIVDALAPNLTDSFSLFLVYALFPMILLAMLVALTIFAGRWSRGEV